MKPLLTIIRVQDLYCSRIWEFQGRHHRLGQNNLEVLRHLVVVVWQDPDLPDGCGLAWVELNLFLRFPPEIFVFFCSAILGANTLESTKKWFVSIVRQHQITEPCNICTGVVIYKLCTDWQSLKVKTFFFHSWYPLMSECHMNPNACVTMYEKNN